MEQLILMAAQWLGSAGYKTLTKKKGAVKLGKWTPVVALVIGALAHVVGIDISREAIFTQSAMVVGIHSAAKNLIQSAK